ncbi:PLD nuclease N-terminal domain-containing protein [Kitasatospora sp. NPDC056076]|uniref:PLD nuclease N-terminal domain-containing protein n=1 Tax=Kitasatospora sp. NPDC056076 TaxID=3345703 RepID=UPI0035E0F922
MLRILLTIVLPLALWVWAFIDCLVTPEGEVRHLPKPIWLIIVLLFPPLGPIAWLVAGKRRGFLRTGAPDGGPGRTDADGRSGSAAPRRGRPVAPDDDPEFLASLGNESARNGSAENGPEKKDAPSKGGSLQKDDKDHEDMLRRWEADLRRREQELRGGEEPEDGRKS